LAKAPGLTAVRLPVFGDKGLAVVSVAVAAQFPAVLKVTLNVPVPPESAALPGITALVSVEVIAIVWVLTAGFQLVSTALTVTEKGVPAV
jgi:hypothetical protein